MTKTERNSHKTGAIKTPRHDVIVTRHYDFMVGYGLPLSSLGTTKIV